MELLAILMVVPLGLYLLHARGRGQAWGLLPAGEEIRGGGAYRQVRVRTWKRGAAPGSVRIAALSCFFLGQMIVPGVLAALGGVLVLAAMIGGSVGVPLLAVVLLLSAPTGLIAAAYLLSAGSAMLERADDAAPRARRTARWALGHNLVLLVALGLAAAAAPEHAGDALVPALCACLSIAQALLVRHAAGVIEAYARRQDRDPAPLQAEIEILGGIR